MQIQRVQVAYGRDAEGILIKRGHLLVPQDHFVQVLPGRQLVFQHYHRHGAVLGCFLAWSSAAAGTVSTIAWQDHCRPSGTLPGNFPRIVRRLCIRL